MPKASEFRLLNDDELMVRLSESKQELFQMRFETVTGQLINTARLGQVRNDIARMNSILREREIEAAEKLETEGAK